MAGHSARGDTSRRSVIYVALAGNLLVAISKFVAAAWTGSSAMLSEGVHSVVDTLNELLLLYGIHRSTARPDRDHPLGYGREIYFWSFVVALLILTGGAGVSLYEGITHIIEPHSIENANVSYIVLGLSALFEGTSWGFTLRRFKGNKRYTELFKLVVYSKDPPTFIVLLEDSAALVGLIIAFLGVYFSVTLDEPALDGIASIFIGITLALMAILMARETKELLIGEAASQRVHESILNLAEETDGVSHANGMWTVQLAPKEILVALSVEFTDALRVPNIEAIVVELEQNIRARHPDVVAVFVKPQTHERFVQSALHHFGRAETESQARSGHSH